MARMIDPRLIVMSILMSIVMSVLLSILMSIVMSVLLSILLSILMSVLMSVLMSALMSVLMSALVRTHLMINRSHMPHMKRALPTVRPPQRTAQIDRGELIGAPRPVLPQVDRAFSRGRHHVKARDRKEGGRKTHVLGVDGRTGRRAHGERTLVDVLRRRGLRRARDGAPRRHLA